MEEGVGADEPTTGALDGASMGAGMAADLAAAASGATAGQASPTAEDQQGPLQGQVEEEEAALIPQAAQRKERASPSHQAARGVEDGEGARRSNQPQPQIEFWPGSGSQAVGSSSRMPAPGPMERSWPWSLAAGA